MPVINTTSLQNSASPCSFLINNCFTAIVLPFGSIPYTKIMALLYCHIGCQVLQEKKTTILGVFCFNLIEPARLLKQLTLFFSIDIDLFIP